MMPDQHHLFAFADDVDGTGEGIYAPRKERNLVSLGAAVRQLGKVFWALRGRFLSLSRIRS